MSVATKSSTKTRTVILTIRDTLDFTMSQVSSGENPIQGCHEEMKINFVVDLAKVKSIKDSGQDLLWMLKECADKEQASISIIHCNSHLRQELWELGLDQYFNINEVED